MANSRYNYTKNTEFSFQSGARRAFDISPGPSDLAIPTRAITLSADATVTGIFVGDDHSHTTHTLKAGIMYPLCFKKITAVSTGTVKGYA